MTLRLFAVAIGAGALTGCARCDCGLFPQDLCTLPVDGVGPVPPDVVLHGSGVSDLVLTDDDGAPVPGSADQTPLYGMTFTPSSPLRTGSYELADPAVDWPTWQVWVDEEAAPTTPSAPPPDTVSQEDVRLAHCCEIVHRAVLLDWDEPPEGVAGWEVQASRDERFDDPVSGLSNWPWRACVADRPYYFPCTVYPLRRGATVWIRVRPIGLAGEFGEWLDPVEVRFGLL